jgi:hypothetical protein
VNSFLEALVHLVCLPYDLWKGTIENSRVGPSEWDLETLRFWKWVATIGTGILIALGGGAALCLRFFSS